jgi:hypothetical protein
MQKRPTTPRAEPLSRPLADLGSAGRSHELGSCCAEPDGVQAQNGSEGQYGCSGGRALSQGLGNAARFREEKPPSQHNDRLCRVPGGNAEANMSPEFALPPKSSRSSVQTPGRPRYALSRLAGGEMREASTPDAEQAKGKLRGRANTVCLKERGVFELVCLRLRLCKSRALQGGPSTQGCSAGG